MDSGEPWDEAPSFRDELDGTRAPRVAHPIDFVVTTAGFAIYAKTLASGSQ
jgi:hypothetical protein